MFCSVNGMKACFLSPDVLQIVWFRFERLTVLRYTHLISIYCPCVLLSLQKKKGERSKRKNNKAANTSHKHQVSPAHRPLYSHFTHPTLTEEHLHLYELCCLTGHSLPKFYFYFFLG